MEELGAISQWLAAHAGLSSAVLGQESLRRAVDRRQRATGLAQLHAYRELLQASGPEQQALVDLLVVPESWFFRDRQPYAALALHARQWLAPTSGAIAAPHLRLLSAPCAGGEEPYSMAMTLLDDGLPAQAFRIDAIDISTSCLERARRAVYGRHAFRGVTADEQQRHFEATEAGWSPQAAVRGCVHFRQGNLVNDLAAAPGPYDVVFCRNLMIYLHQGAVEGLLAAIARRQRPGGLLVVATAELPLVPTSLYEPLRQPPNVGFRRRAADGDEPVTTPVPNALPTKAAAGLEGDLDRCRRRIQRDPTSASTCLQMAELLVQSDDPDQAFNWLRKGLYLQPRSRTILEQLIRLSRATGQLEQGRRYEERLARLER